MVILLYDEDGEPVALGCETCGLSRPFDPAEPFLRQSTAFLLGHDCP